MTTNAKVSIRYILVFLRVDDKLRQETEMTTTLKTSIALGFTIAFNLGAYSVYAASAPDQTQSAVRHYKTDFGKAKALAPTYRLQPAPSERIPETDGLSRNDEDCNYGCINH